MLKDLILGNYKTVSERLGLALGDERIHGIVDGAAVQMWFGAHATHVGALLSHPAPIELSIATKGLVAKFAELFGSHSAGLGDAVLDEVFVVKTADLARLSALLNGAARKALLEIAKEGLHPAVDAHSVHLRRFSQGGLADSEAMIERDFREAARLASVIGASFAAGCR